MAEGAEVPGEISPKNDVTGVIKFANLGNQPARKVVVTLLLGSGLSIAHSDPRASGTGTNSAYAGGVTRWDIGDLGVGMSRTIRSVIHATSIPDDGTLVAASVTADGIDLDTSNNSASLLWHSPLPPGALKGPQSSATVREGTGFSEKTSARPASHRWRHFFEFVFVIAAVLIFLRTKRKP
jgi:hypothetical protein